MNPTLRIEAASDFRSFLQGVPLDTVYIVVPANLLTAGV